MRAPFGLTASLRRMVRYGILSRFLPEFGHIIGQMQHDLFHNYTVDAHTILLIKYMRRFNYRESREQFPVACIANERLDKPELLYIAGLYHDIGKGRAAITPYGGQSMCTALPSATASPMPMPPWWSGWYATT